MACNDHGAEELTRCINPSSMALRLRGKCPLRKTSRVPKIHKVNISPGATHVVIMAGEPASFKEATVMLQPWPGFRHESTAMIAPVDMFEQRQSQLMIKTQRRERVCTHIQCSSLPSLSSRAADSECNIIISPKIFVVRVWMNPNLGDLTQMGTGEMAGISLNYGLLWRWHRKVERIGSTFG